MVEFNPKFQFEDEEASILNKFAHNEMSDDHSIYKLDALIQKYRQDNKDVIDETIDEDVEIEQNASGVSCKIQDSLRSKFKSKKKKLSAEEEEKIEKQYEFMQSVTKYTDVDSFISFKLSKPLLKSLTEMNVYKPTPIQCACIPVALMNRDICACARTGSGKTLAFLLPIIERLVYAPMATRSATKALIVSPTRELAVQIFKVAEQLVKFCPKLKIQLAAGGLDLSSQEASLRTNPDIVVATPGRLIDHLSNAPNFTLSNIEFLVLDEADKLLDEYFTEQIREIVRHCSSQRQTMLFSATMTETVRELATVSLKNPVRIFLNQSTAVANRLEQEFVRIRQHRESDRDAMLAALLVRSFPRRTIVFLQTKRDCHRMHILLGLLGLHCAELHGDMNQAQRLEALRRFTDDSVLPAAKAVSTTMDKTSGEGPPNPASSRTPPMPPVDILLATDLAARGLDIPHVETVINYRLPPNLKNYIHRVGRTARAANAGRAVSLAGESDRKILKDIVKDAPFSVKARVIPQEVITRFNARIAKMKPFLNEILTSENEERELQAAEAQIAKAERLAASGKKRGVSDDMLQPSIRPKRVNWFSEKRDADREAHKIALKSKHGKKSLSKRPQKS